jgi:segregation and condensation protein A
VTGELAGTEAVRAPAAETANPAFEVHLAEFEGPFDLLLGLIAKHELDITALALSKVTDEFIGYIRNLGSTWDLGQASEFLVIAATLVDLKAARLLPAAEVEDEEDLALLEVRDLLFARLLQYRAYKQVAAILETMFAAESRRFARDVRPEPRFEALLPEVLIGLGLEQFAELAARTLAPRVPVLVSIEHLHAPAVSVREQAGIISGRLRTLGSAMFRSLTADCTGTLEVVARFLALLELFRDGAVSFEQVTPLGDLLVRWTASESYDADNLETDEFDQRIVTVPETAPVVDPVDLADHEAGPDGETA